MKKDVDNPHKAGHDGFLLSVGFSQCSVLLHRRDDELAYSEFRRPNRVFTAIAGIHGLSTTRNLPRDPRGVSGT